MRFETSHIIVMVFCVKDSFCFCTLVSVFHNNLFLTDVGDCRLLQNTGIYHIFQTVRSTVSWKYNIKSSCVLESDGI